MILINNPVYPFCLRFDGVEIAPICRPVCTPKFNSEILHLLILLRIAELTLSSPIVHAQPAPDPTLHDTRSY